MGKYQRLELIKVCVVCGKEYPASKTYQKYCGKSCARSNHSKHSLTSVVKSEGVRLSTGTIGAITELVVSADLMKKGYEVFRALSPSCSCDVLALKDGLITKFEIRTGTYTVNNILSYGKANVRADKIAVATYSDNAVHYIEADTGVKIII